MIPPLPESTRTDPLFPYTTPFRSQQDLKRARPTIFFSVTRLWTKFYLAINAKLPPRKQKLLFSIPLLSRVIKRKILSELRSEEHTSELQSLMRTSYDVFCLKKKKK